MGNSICSACASSSLKNKIDLFSEFQELDKKEKACIVDNMSRFLRAKAIVNQFTDKHEDNFASFNTELETNADTYLKVTETAVQIFTNKKFGRMAGTGDDKGNVNKRKFTLECSRDPPSTLTEFPRYEVLEENFRQAMGKFESCEDLSRQTKDKLGLHSSPEGKDTMITQLQEILKNGLTLIYHKAISKIIEHGYSKEIAECAALRSGPHLGKGDILSNIVDGALDLLERNKEFDTSKRHMFEDLDNLVEYTMLEMTCMLREVNPCLSVVDAMFCLFLFDMNLPLACAVQKDPHKFCKECKGESSSESTLDQKVNSNSQKSNITVLNSNKLKCKPDLTVLSRQLLRELQQNEKESEDSVQVETGKSSIDTKKIMKQSAVEAALKVGIARKGCVHTSKSDLLQQRTFQFENSHKRPASKMDFKSKLISWGALVNSKNSSIQIPETESKTPVGMPQEKEKSTQKTRVNTPSPPKTAEYYCASIPYDESQGKYVAQTEKDEIILALVSQMQCLETEVQKWKDWVNEKIMEAAGKLSKDQAEIKDVRLENEKTELEKILSVEDIVKQLSEMENTLTSANGYKELADSTADRVKAERSVLRQKEADAEEKGLQEAEKLEKAKLRENEALKKCQLIGTETTSLLDEHKALKKEADALQMLMEKSKAVIDQIEVQRAHEESEKKKFLKKAENTRKDTECIEAETKAEEGKFEENTKKEMQKHTDEVTKIKQKMLELKLENESLKIAKLNTDTSLQQHPKVSKRLEVFRNNFGGRSLKQEHECVMCLAKEKSVVFLPCAHQVLCVDCNEVHQKKDMKYCPSCRTPIQRRINARFAQ